MTRRRELDRKLQLQVAGRQAVPRVIPSAIGVDEERQTAVLGVRAGENLLRHHLAVCFGQGTIGDIEGPAVHVAVHRPVCAADLDARRIARGAEQDPVVSRSFVAALAQVAERAGG